MVISKMNDNSSRRLISIIIINLILFFLFFELMSLGVYFYKRGKLFYTSTEQIKLIQVREGKELTPKRLHPIFGFTTKTGYYTHVLFFQMPELENKKIATNNYGFYSEYDYPFIKSSKKQYIIGIFGGSVSERFYLQVKDRLVKNLKKNKLFKDKEIIVLNFGSGGYKQPQQLQILTYFSSIGQQFDIVINIDGFNEVALSNINNQLGKSIYMPSVQHLLPLINLTNQTSITPEKLTSLYNINNYREKLNEIARKNNNNKFASEWILLKLYYRFLYDKYRQELVMFDQLNSNQTNKSSITYIKLQEDKIDSNILFDKIADNWVTSSIMMKQLLDSKEAYYFHFLQPNQYYSNRKFSGEELNLFIGNTPYIDGAKTGYPVLVEKSELLIQNELNFYSGIDIFDNEPQTVYIDNCCHYNQLGNKILVDFITEHIVEYLN